VLAGIQRNLNARSPADVSVNYCSRCECSSLLSQCQNCVGMNSLLIMNWKEYGRNRPWANRGTSAGLCLEGLINRTTKTLGQDTWYVGRDSNLLSPEYTRRMLALPSPLERKCYRSFIGERNCLTRSFLPNPYQKPVQ
jgi:hypothetical protein